MENKTAWTNGRFCARDQLSLDIQDFGVIHGDGAYDTIYLAQGRAFMLNESWQRFNDSAQRFRLDVNISLKDFIEITGELLKNQDLQVKDCIANVIITRGIPKVMGALDTCSPTISIFLKPMPVKFPRGYATAWLSKNIRRIPDESIDQKYKHFAWGDLTVAQFEAIDQDYDLGIVRSSNGYISEGFACGVCCYRDNVIYSPKNNRVNSTTITALAQISGKYGYRFQYKDLTEEDFYSADGMIACAISGFCTRVSKFNHHDFDLSRDMSDKFNTWIRSNTNFFTPII